MYSPVPIENAPATSAAAPVSTIVCADTPPPPSPAISEAFVTRPSTAPNTVGRSQPPETSRWPCDQPATSAAVPVASDGSRLSSSATCPIHPHHVPQAPLVPPIMPTMQQRIVTDAVRIEPGNRVLITGASGFIGSAVARAVQGRGAELVVLVAPDADDRNLKDIDAERIVADIRDVAAVRAACLGSRFVFHLAAMYRFWARDPRVFYDVNLGGTLNRADAGPAAGCGGRGVPLAGGGV